MVIAGHLIFLLTRYLQTTINVHIKILEIYQFCGKVTFSLIYFTLQHISRLANVNLLLDIFNC